MRNKDFIRRFKETFEENIARPDQIKIKEFDGDAIAIVINERTWIRLYPVDYGFYTTPRIIDLAYYAERTLDLLESVKGTNKNGEIY